MSEAEQQQAERLIIENQNEDGSYDMKGIANDIAELLHTGNKPQQPTGEYMTLQQAWLPYHSRKCKITKAYKAGMFPHPDNCNCDISNVIETHAIHLQAAVREAEKITGDTSDGHHTFDELYGFRMAYNALLFNEWAAQGTYNVHLSYRHHDGELCFGKENYFVVVATTPFGQISNHYKGKYRDLFKVHEVERAIEWDGHTPQQALERMLQQLNQSTPTVDSDGGGETGCE